ncbi:MAG TPA: hypothetical protein VFX58_16095 [Chitinophagaceae bacterium]|nr:hypothetical protein [Chitinophagaceae bacterium]
MYQSPTRLFFLTFLLFNSFYLLAQSPVIAVIDFYGMNKVTEKQIREQLGLREGDSVQYFSGDDPIKKIEAIPGVWKAAIATVCCDDRTGQSIAYIGIAEKPQAAVRYHPAPTSPVILPVAITDAYNDFFARMVEGIQQGQSGEDRTQGHALAQYAPARAKQQQFVQMVKTHLPVLKKVLRSSVNAEQRSIAAYVLAYASDKNLVIPDLLYAVQDGHEHVRNNATRALALIAAYAAHNPAKKLQKIPAAPFISLINSLTWTDRNKGAAVLLALTETRDKAILQKIKQTALTPIIDMAQWKSKGHAIMGYLLLGRLAGASDKKIYTSFDSESKNAVLQEWKIKLKEFL